MTHAFGVPVPEEVREEEDWREKVARLVESVAISRSGLIQCRLREGEEEPTAEVVVTLHHDGITKQSFLTALEETEKVRRVIEWGLESISSSIGILSDVRSVVEQTEALTSEVSKGAEGVEEPVAPVSAPTAAPTAITPPPEAVPLELAGRFCSKCGKEAKPGQRFCIGCGTSLEVQG